MHLQTDIQNLINKMLILLVCLFVKSTFILGQDKKSESILVMKSDLARKNYYYGDTISFTIENKTGSSRGYTVEALCQNISNEYRKAYFNNLYTAYFNRDTAFLLKLKMNQTVARENKLNYVIPDVALNAYLINANSRSTYYFIIKGESIKTNITIKFKITSDIIDDEFTTIETRPFNLFITP